MEDSLLVANPRTITLEECRALPECVRGAAVYFLWDGQDLLYVGASRADASERVARHYRAVRFNVESYGTAMIPFKESTMFKCVPEDVWDFERIFIKRFDPPYNSMTNSHGC